MFFSLKPASTNDTVKPIKPSLWKRLFKRFFFYLFFLVVLAITIFLSTIIAGFFSALGANLATATATLLAVVLAYLITKFSGFTDKQAHIYLIIAVLLSFMLDFTAVAVTLILLPQILKKFKLI